ncbi:MAG TPA: OmpA family protein, partial [Candidatus Krumholzibacteria bacterium]|nr:OmpA family protein [Candidatus Krumholzibacteria bacterium]
MTKTGQNHGQKVSGHAARRLVVSCFLGAAPAAIAALFLLAVFCPPAHAQTTPSGTIISNTAHASFVDGAVSDTSSSTTTITRVATIHAMRLSPPGTTTSPAFVLQGAPRDTLYSRLTLDNLSNAPDSAIMTALSLAPAPISPAVVFFLDANGNQKLDAGEDSAGFLMLAAGASTPVDVAFVLPPAPANGTVNVELRVTSAFDPGRAAARASSLRLAPATDATVVRVTSVLSAALMYFGPEGNPRAQPGGEGSRDDEASVAVGLYDESTAVRGEIENASLADSIELFVAPSSPLPPGVRIACTDTSGVAHPAGSRPGSFVIGAFASGQIEPLRIVLSSSGTPLRVAMGGVNTLDFTARSLSDTTATNSMRARFSISALPDARTIVSLEQTFRQPTATLGDVATMIITVTNRTDSVQVDNLHVTEAPPASLDFISGQNVTRANRSLVWQVGALAPGETRSTAVKFAVNGREPKGWARVPGTARGNAGASSLQSAEVIAALRIDNEETGIEGFVLGDVWIDTNNDGHRDVDEHGAPNVSVFLESGEYAVTDSTGQFAIPHVFEGERVLRIDETTLPEGTELADNPVNLARGGRPGERLVHLIAPAHVRVEFPLHSLHTAAAPIERTARVACEELVSVTPRPRLYSALKLPSSQFDFGQAKLVGNAAEGLRPVAAFLIGHPGWLVMIDGHTDNVPIHSSLYASNRELSTARASAVREALAGMGVAWERVLVNGYADTRPIASNETPDGRSMNRRVEVSLVSPADAHDDPALLINHAMRELPSAPDSVSGNVRWSLTTTSHVARRCTLRFDIPSALATETKVSYAGAALTQSADGAFAVDHFVRGGAIECRIAFTAAAVDTPLVRAIAATVALTDSSGADLGQETLHPGSPRGAASHDLMTWTERVDPPADPPLAPRAAPVAPVAQDGPVVILDPADGTVVPDRDQTGVTVRHPLGDAATLTVNGDEVGDEHIGRRVIDVKNSTETTTWYGIPLSEGWNTIVASATTETGTAADTARVARSSKPAEIVPPAVRTLVVADGHSTSTVQFQVRDGFGLPVMDGFVVTLTEGADAADVVDARPADRGVQLTTHDGVISIPLRPNHASGNATLAVEADGMRAETDVAFITTGRPLLATGVVDASAGSYQKHGDGSGHGVTNFTDGLSAEAQARLFVQGAVPGGFRLTGRLDTRKRYDDPLLKQPDPERQYPIFGDASTLGYAAPARGGNYVSLDRGQSYLRYGDFNTPVDRGEFLTYHQAVTGLTSSVTNGSDAVSAFVTKADFVTRTDDIPADGTSGFYYLTHAPIVENSERVIVETRDRYQSEKVIESHVMTRRRDYTINPYDGSILFMEPVSATDRNLNPNRIVVMYETDTGSSDAVLFGARGDVVGGKHYRAGATAIANSGDLPGYSLVGADGEARLRGLRLAGELAHSDDDNVGKGNAFKVGASAERGASKLDLYLRRVDGDFSNPSFRSADTELASLKAGFEGRLACSQSLTLAADGYSHELDRTFERRETVRGLLDYRRRLIAMSAGLRVARHDQPTQDADGLLSLAGVTVGNPNALGVSTTWEQNLGHEIVDDYPNRLKTT